MRSTAFLRLLMVLLALPGCATGFGDDATGTVFVSIVPAGSVSGGVKFHSATLTLGEAELTEVEGSEPAGDDHGHDHSHSHLFDSTLLTASTHLPLGSPRIDLLGTEQPLRELQVPATTFGALNLEAEDATDGDEAGCALHATGEARILDDRVPVRICLAALEPLVVSIPLEMEVGLDQAVSLRLFLAVHDLLVGIELGDLVREADGSIVIDERRTPYAASRLRQNLLTAFSAI